MNQNQNQLLQSFLQPVSEGMSIQELDQLLGIIENAFSNQINSNQIDEYMQNNYNQKMIAILRTIYHYNSIKQLNPNVYNNSKFAQLLIFSQIYLKKLSTFQNEQELQQIFVLTVFLGIKYYNVQSKQISALISVVFEACQEKSEYFDVLLQQMSDSLKTNQNIYSVLFILDQLIRFLFNIRVLDTILQQVVDQIFGLLQLIDYNNKDINLGINLSSIIVICIQKYKHYKQEKLIALSQNQYLLQFFLQYLFVNNEIIEGNILKSIQTLIEQQITFQDKLFYDQNQTPLLAQLTNQILPQLVEQCILSKEYVIETSLINFLITCIGYQFTYGFFQKYQNEILFRLIFEKLLLEEKEIDNYHENPTDFYELIQGIVKEDKDTLKGLAATLLKKMTQLIDGFLSNFYKIGEELLKFQFEQLEETPICNSLPQQFHQSPIFLCDPEKRYCVIILSYCILHQQLSSRRDIRQQLEHFLKNNLKNMKKKVDNIGKCLGIEFIKLVLPELYKHSQKSFEKCVKFTFNILNQSKQKKGVKLFAIKCLQDLILNPEISLKVEESIALFHKQFNDQLSVCEFETYYDFALTVVENCNTIIDTYLEEIMRCLCKRIEKGCQRIQQEKAQYVNHTAIVFQCIQIIDKILSQSYCLKYNAQIEPTLISIVSILLVPQNETFIDETLDVISKYIAFTKGLTEIFYIIFDNLPNLIGQSKNYTISTVFQFFLSSTLFANEILISKPEFISTMFKFVYNELCKDNNSFEDNIKISILIHQFYQYFNLDEGYILFTEQYVKILEKQLQTKEIQPKCFISIFMPAIMNNSKLMNQNYKNLVTNTCAYINFAYGKALSIYNYKYFFALINFLITNSHLLFEDQIRFSIIEQFFNNFLSKYGSYLDKINLNQKLSTSNTLQQATKQIPTFDVEYEESSLDLHLKEMSNYKKETNIEKSIINDLEMAPIMQEQFQRTLVRQLMQYLSVNYPQIIQNLQQADKMLLNQISQMEYFEFETNKTEVRQIISLGMMKRKGQQTKQYNVM